MQKISNFEKFIVYARRWKQYDHKYDKVYDVIDLANSNDKYTQGMQRKIYDRELPDITKTLQTSREIPQQNELGADIYNQTLVNHRRSNSTRHQTLKENA